MSIKIGRGGKRVYTYWQKTSKRSRGKKEAMVGEGKTQLFVGYTVRARKGGKKCSNVKGGDHSLKESVNRKMRERG